MTRYPLRPLGEVLELDSESVPVEAVGTYNVAGIYSFGRGVFGRAPIAGTDTHYASLHRLRAGQFVISRLKAFEGAVAVVPPEFDGWFLSREFPTFRITDRADTRFIAYLCRWPDFWQSLQRASKGVGARRERVHPERLLTIEVPLPAVDEQRRVAAHLDATLNRVARIEELVSKAETLAGALLASVVNSSAVAAPVGEIVTQVERREAVHPEREYTLMGVRWYGEGLFVRERKPGHELAATHLQLLCPGDFVYNRLFAWKGSFALVRQDHEGVYASSEFPAFKVDERKALPEYLLAYFRTPVVWADALGRSAGGTPTSRNRLKEDRFLAMTIPLPPIERQMVVVDLVREIDHLVARMRAQTPTIEALARSILNRTFAGAL